MGWADWAGCWPINPPGHLPSSRDRISAAYLDSTPTPQKIFFCGWCGPPLTVTHHIIIFTVAGKHSSIWIVLWLRKFVIYKSNGSWTRGLTLLTDISSSYPKKNGNISEHAWANYLTILVYMPNPNFLCYESSSTQEQEVLPSGSRWRSSDFLLEWTGLLLQRLQTTVDMELHLNCRLQRATCWACCRWIEIRPSLLLP